MMAAEPAIKIAVDILRPHGAEPQLRIYARDSDSKVCFIADGSPADGELRDIAFFDTEDEAAAVATACAAFLDATPTGPVDDDGWHALPPGARIAEFLPNLLKAARNAVWAARGAEGPAAAPEEPSGPAVVILAAGDEDASRTERKAWTGELLVALVSLVWQGLTAKQIAAHPDIAPSTPGAVTRQVNRLGLRFGDALRGNICFRAPLGPTVMIDRAARDADLTRSQLMRYWTIKAAADPDVYGMTAIRNHLRPRRTVAEQPAAASG